MDLKVNYGLIVVHPDKPCEILQFIGYGEPPVSSDILALRTELKNDSNLGLQDQWDEVEILEATEEQVKEYQKWMETPVEESGLEYENL